MACDSNIFDSLPQAHAAPQQARVYPYIIVIGIMIGTSACGGAVTTRTLERPPEPCVISASPMNPADTVRIALMDPIDAAHAPSGTNDSEQLVFAQAYEGLTRLDCAGEIAPSVAHSWNVDATGKRWTFDIDRNARFSDGTVVTARDIAEQYASAPIPTIDSVTATGLHKLDVYLSVPSPTRPPLETTRMFVVKKTNRLPLGTGRIAYSDVGRDWILGQTIEESTTATPRPVFKFVAHEGDDPRDVLAESVDLLVTSDPAAIEYAARQIRYTVHALPWDRTYLLVSRSRSDSIAASRPVAGVTKQALDALARDAVRADASGADPEEWWQRIGRCQDADDASHHAASDRPMREPVPLRHGLIVYDEEDDVSRDLAARIVALGANGLSSTGGLRAAIPRLGDDIVLAAEGVDKVELSRRLRAGNDFLYLIEQRLPGGQVCDHWVDLLERAPWLQDAGIQSYRAVLPLVYTRRHAIIDTSRVGVRVDGMGRLLIEPYRAEGNAGS